MVKALSPPCAHTASLSRLLSLSLSHLYRHSWSDLRPEGALVTVWAQGGQAPEITLGLAFFPLAFALCAWPAKLPAQPSCSPSGCLGVGTKNKNPTEPRSVTCLLRDTAGWTGEQSTARLGEGPGQLCHSNWKCSLWEQLGACCKGGVLQSTLTPQHLFPYQEKSLNLTPELLKKKNQNLQCFSQTIINPVPGEKHLLGP